MIADGLERMAKKVRGEEEILRMVAHSDNPRFNSYGRTVEEIHRIVLWGLANLHLDGLVHLPSEADVARATGGGHDDAG
jgi:hypothetical protein